MTDVQKENVLRDLVALGKMLEGHEHVRDHDDLCVKDAKKAEETQWMNWKKPHLHNCTICGVAFWCKEVA